MEDNVVHGSDSDLQGFQERQNMKVSVAGSQKEAKAQRHAVGEHRERGLNTSVVGCENKQWHHC
eukprot:8639571-Heterocapsa_arctica.AAC.1